MRFPLVICVFVFVAVTALLAQSPNGNINGLVSDPSSAAVVAAEIVAINDVTGVQYAAKSNSEGIYVLSNLPPGPYRLQVSKVGFKTIIKPDIVLNVQDALSVNFTLPIGALHEIVTVEGGAPLVNTESAAVSTVVDRQFAEQLPLNGRSFQTLIQLTPGVVLTASNSKDGGQFSVNGQRPTSNYWMVDGVSANIGIGVTAFSYPGNGLGGALGSFSAVGGTNSLVSVDALQEFRIQTSTYAPEFGRTPGGQISIVTRSGTNRFHGTTFDYLRNDVFDANDWFANFAGLPKAKERQNDFGGTLSGPIVKDRTFFFFSYEGLRLRLPETLLTTVPDVNARRNAVAAMQPYLDAYPLPNGPAPFDGQGNPIPGAAQFDATFSNRATLDAYSIRIDHRLNNKFTLFGRYNYSPSAVVQRGANTFLSASNTTSTQITTQTATVGATWAISTAMTNDLRFNYSRAEANSYASSDSFGGAVPLSSLSFPSPFTAQNAFLSFNVTALQQGELEVGRVGRNLQRQFNLVDSTSLQRGTHSLKVGVDFRRLSPLYAPDLYNQDAFFNDVPSTESGTLSFALVESNLSSTFLFRNLGIYAQDNWRILPRLMLTYGVRWDADFVPRSLQGPTFAAVTGFDLKQLSQLTLAPPGTPAYTTTYTNFAPRLGVAYQLSQSQDSQTVLRGGFGLFYDLATSEMGNQISNGNYPFGTSQFNSGGTFPLDPAAATPPAITPPNATNFLSLFAIDPQLQLPYTLGWNVAVEQGLGHEQSISATYTGAAGRRLLQSALAIPSNLPGGVQLLTNAGSSDYDALQLQFQRRLSHGLQSLASYTWAHSIDTGSAGSTSVSGNKIGPSLNPNVNRGPSDFDVRNAFSLGMTYDIPSPKTKTVINAILHDWSIQNLVLARSAPPVDVLDAHFQVLDNFLAAIRPDLVPGKSFYLYGSEFPGRKALNPSAFTDPPTNPSSGTLLRQGTLSRNALRGFGATQWDLAIHRDFPIYESLKMQFRAEMFNILNHPNFGPPNGSFGRGGFGLSTQMLGQSLSGNVLGGGAFNPLYQIGGPRSIQLALKLQF